MPKKSYGLVVEVADPLPVELRRHRRPVDAVDPVVRDVGDLVVHGVGVRREEVRVRAHLVDVEVQDRRQLSDELELRVRSPAGSGRTSRGSCRCRRRCGACPPRGRRGSGPAGSRRSRCRGSSRTRSRPVGELVEQLEGRLGAALLAAVDVRLHQQDRGGRGGERLAPDRRASRVAELVDRGFDRGQAVGRDVLRARRRSRTGAGVPRRRTRRSRSSPGRSRRRSRRGRRPTRRPSPPGRRGRSPRTSWAVGTTPANSGVVWIGWQAACAALGPTERPPTNRTRVISRAGSRLRTRRAIVPPSGAWRSPASASAVADVNRARRAGVARWTHGPRGRAGPRGAGPSVDHRRAARGGAGPRSPPCPDVAGRSS